MVNTLSPVQDLQRDIDTWVGATWDEFLAIVSQPEFEKSRCYYETGWMRIETMPIGNVHGHDNSTLAAVNTLYGTFKNIAYIALTNSSFRKVGERECQPDLAYYISKELPNIPRSNSPVDIDRYGAPTLAIEIASTALSDDLGRKRLLYERLGVQEYWVVSVEAAEVIAFEVSNGGSRQIQVSRVLPGLSMDLIESALQRSQVENDSVVNQWLIQQFSLQ